MKYLITESKLNQVIFKYLDNQDFIQIDKDNSIYFVYSEDDEYAKIKFNKLVDACYISDNLIWKISDLFSLHHFDSKTVIGKWIEDTLQVNIVFTLATVYINNRRTY